MASSHYIKTFEKKKIIIFKYVMLVIDLLKYVLPDDTDKQCGHYILVTGLRLT